MVPHPQIFSRDDTSTISNRMTPVSIGGIVFAGALFTSLCLWLGVRTCRKWSRKQRSGERQGVILTIKGFFSEGDEKAAAVPRIAVTRPPVPVSREKLTASIVMPHQNIIRPDATKDDILRYHITTSTMTRPFSDKAHTLVPSSSSSSSSSAATAAAAVSRPISTVSFPREDNVPPRRTSFFDFGKSRPQSTASAFDTASSSILGVQDGRKVCQLFTPVLPDELVLSLEEKVAVVQSFDDGWCIVCRDSPLKPGEVQIGAVPAWSLVKPAKRLIASRPMRTTSLGVTVQINAGPGSSPEEVISWSNF